MMVRDVTLPGSAALNCRLGVVMPPRQVTGSRHLLVQPSLRAGNADIVGNRSAAEEETSADQAGKLSHALPLLAGKNK